MGKRALVARLVTRHRSDPPVFYFDDGPIVTAKMICYSLPGGGVILLRAARPFLKDCDNSLTAPNLNSASEFALYSDGVIYVFVRGFEPDKIMGIGIADQAGGDRAGQSFPEL
jgi:hypothetical protein